MPLFPDARQTDWNGIITGTKEKLQTAVSGLSDCDTSLKQAERELEEENENWEQFKNK